MIDKRLSLAISMNNRYLQVFVNSHSAKEKKTLFGDYEDRWNGNMICGHYGGKLNLKLKRSFFSCIYLTFWMKNRVTC